MNALSLNLVGGNELVEGTHLHTEALGDAGNVATDITESEDSQALALQLGTGLAVVEVADGVDEESEDELCHGIGVLARCILDHDTLLLGVSGVDGVVACAGSDDNLQVLGGVENVLCHLVGAHNHGVGIADSTEELSLTAIFLQ